MHSIFLFFTLIYDKINGYSVIKYLYNLKGGDKKYKHFI